MAPISKLKLVRWGWLSGTLSILTGAFILATFLALFNYRTPSGKIAVTGRVVEVTPNVTGQIVAIPVKPNVPVKAGDVLFQFDPAPYKFKVAQLRASLAAARQQAKVLKSNYEQATANVEGRDAQSKYNTKRLADIQTLYSRGANTGDMQGYLNLKGYGEFAAANRPAGWNTWLTFSISPTAPAGTVAPTRRIVTK